MSLLRKSFELHGIIQGLGIRPTVHRIAKRFCLGGSVQNLGNSVRLELEGSEGSIEAFLCTLLKEVPSATRIDLIKELRSEPVSEVVSDFKILESAPNSEYAVSFPPDLALCRDCLAEIFNPADRRYGYPFTSCTVCGPRYTVIEGMPYDRERTTLKFFPLCKDCQEEYRNPFSRRFHAESIACPKCGPKMRITDKSGKALNQEPLSTARQGISEGKILALRGIGGFLLSLDAFNSSAIKELRLRKQRPHKPLAVMMRDLSVVKRFCHVSAIGESLLQSAEAPIVILDLKEEARRELPVDLLAPDTETLGVMLPYSPLHQLLFHPLKGDPVQAFDVLVMTSGNKRSEPICIKNEEAFLRLQDIADLFLVHDREIVLRADDSLVSIQEEVPQIWRRARGYSPRGFKLKNTISVPSLGMGAELKNTAAIGFDGQIVMSPHIGDLETPEAVDDFEQVIKCFPEFLRREPERVLVDLHPDMHSS
ncbi:MAG: carbamoyltransferase HypF, partial [SAR324 cluster bacterium]|nr:carbamoyltransferase HypF [SAR324 cluster bacterium]